MRTPGRRVENTLGASKIPRKEGRKAHCVSKGGLRLPKLPKAAPSGAKPGLRVSNPTGKGD